MDKDTVSICFVKENFGASSVGWMWMPCYVAPEFRRICSNCPMPGIGGAVHGILWHVVARSE